MVGLVMEKIIYQKYLEGVINRELIIWGVKYRGKVKIIEDLFRKKFIVSFQYC